MCNIVLGAGIAGIAAAYAARQKGLDVTVFEASSRAGGLLDNFQIEGFRFDTAAHLSFASEAEVRSVFDKTPYLVHKPRALCRANDRWLKHPLQNNLFPLSAADKTDLISGLIEQKPVGTENYRDWLISQYGRPIAERYLLVYSEKYWTIPAETLGTRWIGQRMRKSDVREVLRGAFSDDESNTYHIKEMRYPERGGYRAFIEPMIDAIDIRYNHKIEHIDTTRRTVRFESGDTVTYDNLVSTIPLPELAKMLSNIPNNIQSLIDMLFATKLDIISVGFNKPNVSPALWFYIYDRDIIAARAHSPDWKSRDNVPVGCSSLQFEIYSSKRAPQSLSPAEMKANMAYAIEKMGIASHDNILFMDHKSLPYANVVFDLGMEERRDLVKAWLEDHGIVLAGRFGEWDYLWSNQAMTSGLRAAERAFGVGA